MATLKEIEDLTTAFANERRRLARMVEALQADIDHMRREAMPQIRAAVAAAAGAQDRLNAAISDSASLFRRPRTLVIAGIRVGFTKQKGKVEIDDEPATIARIRKLLPVEQAELLIRVREAVHKPAVYDLIAADLKRLGIRVTDDTDAVVIKPTDDAVDKIVATLLDEATGQEAA